MRRHLPLLPPTLLVVVACSQLVLAHATPLTPWKLGGFGMFSTFDHSRSRTLRLRLITDAGTFGVVGPRGSEWTRTWPRARALRAAARTAACERWRLAPFDALHADDPLPSAWTVVYGDPDLRAQSRLAGLAVPAGQGGATVRAVRAEVVQFRLRDGAITPHVIATETADAPARCR